MYLLFIIICKMNDSHDGPLGQSWMRVKYVLSLQVLIRGKIVEFLSRKWLFIHIVIVVSH